MVKIIDPKDAARKLKLIASPGAHGGTNAITAMREGAERLGVKVTPETAVEFFSLLAVVTGSDISDGDFNFLAENLFANASPALLDLLDIKWAKIA